MISSEEVLSKDSSEVARLQKLVKSKNSSDRELRDSLRRIRRTVLSITCSTSSDKSQIELIPKETSGQLRARVWKSILGIYRISALEYSKFIQMGPSPLSEKIDNDAFRTLATDDTFSTRVSESAIKRVLNAFVWKYHDKPTLRFLSLKYSYVQGMNVLVAPFLYVMPELDAFYSFCFFIQNCCPLYVQPALEGVHCGCELVEKCLAEIDPELSQFLHASDLSSTVYAFPLVMTFCACLQPLSEVLKLWDFYFAYGFHHNVLCIIAHLVCIKDELMNSSSPMKILRSLPPLKADVVIKQCLSYVQMLSDELYDILARHPYDPSVYEHMTSQGK